MEEIKFDLIEKVCEKQNFDELLLQIVKSNKENRINRILQNIEENKKFDKKLKRQIYEGIFDYVADVNKYLKNNLKKIFSIAAKETIIQINSELNGGNVDMWRKIKVIIADDNVHFCKFIREYLEKYNDIEILGVANSDEDEIKMIEELKPEIVITDLMRNHRYTGLDIIKKYNDANSKIKFLVISADYKKDVITDELNVAGYIKKPFNDYKVIYDELKRIKKGINENEYKDWFEKYHNLEVRDINDYFEEEDKKIFERLGIKLKNKIYTEFECECLYMDYLTYYDDPECDLSEEEKKFQNLDNGKFSIIGKVNKERTGYINKMTKKAIEEYLRIRDNFNPKTKTLLVSKYGSKMSSTAIEKIIKKAYKLSGINDENYCVHTLRHTCATLLYRNGTDIRTIQELLGHVQIDTTEIYTHLHDQEVMDAMLDHPLSQYKMANAEAFCA